MGMSETINKLDYFQKKKDDLDKLISNLEKEYSQISVMRIITFLVGMALLIIGVSDSKMATGITGGLFLVAFFYLVKKHSDVVRKTEVAKSKLNVVERYIKRFDDQWREFKETGKEYIDKKDTVSMDIDLLGDNSLYQMINVCHTEYGKIYLVDDMKLKFDSINENFCKRPAVEELISSLEFDVDFDNELIYVKNNVAIAADNLSSYNFTINCNVRPSFAVSKSKKTITTTLDKALDGDDIAGNLIAKDIKRKLYSKFRC